MKFFLSRILLSFVVYFKDLIENIYIKFLGLYLISKMAWKAEEEKKFCFCSAIQKEGLVKEADSVKSILKPISWSRFLFPPSLLPSSFEWPLLGVVTAN